MTAMSTAVIGGYQSARGLAGVSITYKRVVSAETTYQVALTAIPGETVHSVERDGQVMDEMKSRDFLILASELVLNGSQTTPARHDVIVEDGKEFHVLAIGPEPQWRYTDPTKAIIRVHTKEVQ